MKRILTTALIFLIGTATFGEYIYETEYFTFHYKTERMQKLHRVDGPAAYGCTACIVASSDVVWRELFYIEGKQHNEAGPAVVNEHLDGSFTYEWWLNNKQYTEAEWQAIVNGGSDGGGKGGGKGGGGKGKNK